MISALMDAPGGGDVAVVHPSALRARFCLSHPTRLLIPVFLVAVFSHLVFEETRCQRDKHAVRGPNRELSVAEGPLCAQIYALHQVVGVMGGAVSWESNGHSNSISGGIMRPPLY